MIVIPSYTDFKNMLVGNIKDMTIVKLDQIRKRDQLAYKRVNLSNFLEVKDFNVIVHWVDKPITEKALLLIVRKRLRDNDNIGLHVVASNGEGLFYKVNGIIRDSTKSEFEYYLKYQVESV